MADEERRYTASHVIAATPWDVYELLVDPDQQGQWKDRYAAHHDVADASPYTRVEFEDGTVMLLEPEGSGTKLTAQRTRTGNGSTGRLGRWLTSRKSVQEDLLLELKRIGSTAESGGI